jgi:hypothetical protein
MSRIKSNRLRGIPIIAVIFLLVLSFVSLVISTLRRPWHKPFTYIRELVAPVNSENLISVEIYNPDLASSGDPCRRIVDRSIALKFLSSLKNAELVSPGYTNRIYIITLRYKGNLSGKSETIEINFTPSFFGPEYKDLFQSFMASYRQMSIGCSS